MQLLEAHTCGGSRTLVTSEECGSKELRLVLEDEEIRGAFTMFEDSQWHDLPHRVPAGVGLEFGERDRRLAAATHDAGAQLDEDAWLVSDDEDFLQNLVGSEVQHHIAVIPIASVPWMFRLKQCGAVSTACLVAILEREQDFLDEKSDISPRKREAKQLSLDRVAVLLGLE